MSAHDLAGVVLARLQGNADASSWADLLQDGVRFEALARTLVGREAVAEQMARTPFSHLEWQRLDRPGLVLAGSPRLGTRDRGVILSLEADDGPICRIAQQNMAMLPQPASPMRMDAALRERFDTALAGRHAMSIAYVDAEGRPHLSLRGSLRTFGDDSLCLWARDPAGGLAGAVRVNRHVALLYRDEEARATYQLAGRARVAEDEPTRARVFEGLPLIEQQHDFARLGAAVIIELDLVEGYAGLGPAGQIDPVRLVRAAPGNSALGNHQPT